MLEPRHLKNAPIVEAVIEFIISPPPGFDIKKLLELKKHLGVDYPNESEIQHNMIQINVGQPMPATNTKGVHVGYRFNSKDGFYVAQLLPQQFIFSRLKPYISWEDFSAEARKIWNLYTTVVCPISSVKRIALRFINQLKLALPAQFEDYLTVPPQIPAGLPQQASSFFSQIVIEDAPNKISTSLVQVTQPLTDPSQLTVIVDITSFRQGDFEMDENKIWAILQTLRDTKNRVFFSSITEKTLKLYE
jgi:uncharacterized protein (TIGR04255 family)